MYITLTNPWRLVWSWLKQEATCPSRSPYTEGDAERTFPITERHDTDQLHQLLQGRPTVAAGSPGGGETHQRPQPL